MSFNRESHQYFVIFKTLTAENLMVYSHPLTMIRVAKQFYILRLIVFPPLTDKKQKQCKPLYIV